MLYSHDISAPPLDVDTAVGGEARARLFARIEASWNRLGVEAPYWSVFSCDGFKPEAMAMNKDAERDFYLSGIDDLDRILATLRRNRIDPCAIERVCEFGCGLGRVTGHLAQRFGLVFALDISENHLALARSRIGAANIAWVKTRVDALRPPEPVDLWFSRIVLQHNPPPMIRIILQEAFASLRRGGVAMFQLPTYCNGYSFSVESYLAKPAASPIEMHILPQQEIHALGREAGLNMMEVVTDEDGMEGWTSQRFVFVRP